jgi:hypothetical protein
MLQRIDPETGKRTSKSSGTADPGEAEKARADLEYELAHSKYQELSKLDWLRFRELFEAEYLPGLRERTREKYTCVLDVFEKIIGPGKLRAVTSARRTSPTPVAWPQGTAAHLAFFWNVGKLGSYPIALL